MDLVQLQNLCKRDSASYKEEFELQFRHYQSLYEIFKLKPSNDSEIFRSLINFLSHVSTCYGKEMAAYPQQLMALLEENYSVLDPELRQALVKALILMRNKNFIEPTALLCLFFKLFRCQDKELRKVLYSHIVNDIKNMNHKAKNNKVNRQLQTFMYQMLTDSNDLAAKQSLDVMIELYRKHIWNDAKTVNVISTACFSKCVKLKTAAFRFFLQTEEEEEEEADTPTVAEVTAQYSTRAAQTRKRKRRLEKALKKCKKDQTKTKEPTPNFPAMELINNPQGFAKKLLGTLRHSSERFEVKLMCANLVSRMISCHKLLVLNFYPFMQKYIQPHHQHLTIILAIVAQASHDLVPPEALQPIVNTLANTFVSEHYAEEIIAIGINTIREICARQPLAMDQETLHSILRLKKTHNKGITMACRSLIGLYREVNPHFLPKADRGKFADMTMVPREYGEARSAHGVEGAELLEESEEDQSVSDESDEDAEIQSPGVIIIDDLEEEEDDNDQDSSEDEDVLENEVVPQKSQVDGDSTKEAGTRPTKRQKLDTQRILTDADFALIKLRQEEALDERTGGAGSYVVEDGDVHAIVDPTDIEGHQKKRMTKEERQEYILSMKDETKQKFGFRQKKTGGKSNREKLKNTPFMLAKQSSNIRKKNKMSIKQKQAKRKRRGKPRRNGQPR